MSYLRTWRNVHKQVELLAEGSDHSDCESESFMTALEVETDSEMLDVNYNSMNGAQSGCSMHGIHTDTTNFDDSDAYIQSSSESEVEDEQAESNLVCELASWAAKSGCSRDAMNDLLHLLREQGLNLPADCRTLMKTPPTVEIVEKCGGTYKHFGLESGIECFLDSHMELQFSELKLKVNVDGLPLFKSSSTQFWPILCAVNNYKLFLVTLFCGISKPSSAKDFLSDFLFELKQLQVNGVQHRGIVLPVSLFASICDAPARSFFS